MTQYATARPTVPTRPKVSPLPALMADAKARGVKGLKCDECGHVHSLWLIGRGCNASHPSIDGATCDGWNLTEIFA